MVRRHPIISSGRGNHVSVEYSDPTDIEAPLSVATDDPLTGVAERVSRVVVS